MGGQSVKTLKYRQLAGIRKLSLALYQELISMGMQIILQSLVVVSKIARFESYAAGLKQNWCTVLYTSLLAILTGSPHIVLEYE